MFQVIRYGSKKGTPPSVATEGAKSGMPEGLGFSFVSSHGLSIPFRGFGSFSLSKRASKPNGSGSSSVFVVELRYQ